jgi:predicted metallopeptidase
MAKAEVTFVRINASSSYTLVRSSASYSDATATEVVLDYDTLNRYFRDGDAVLFNDQAALALQKNLTDSVGSITDAVQSVAVGKGLEDNFGIGDLTHVLLTIQRQYSDAISIGDSPTLSAGINRYEVLNAGDVFSYAASKPLVESISVSDIPVVAVNAPKTDDVTASDVFARVLSYSRTFNDTITMDDFTDVGAITKNTVGSKSNAITFDDVQVFSTNKLVSDTPAISDIYTSAFVKSRADTLSIAESVSVVNRSLLPSRLNAGALNTATLNN